MQTEPRDDTLTAEEIENLALYEPLEPLDDIVLTKILKARKPPVWRCSA